jgi:ferritin-like metal-binding protein YciE
MEQMNDLRALLMHDLQLLYSVEEQLIDSLPAMAIRANSMLLKQAIEEHLEQTREHRDRLDTIRQMMDVTEESVTKYAGTLANLMGEGAMCISMRGILDEARKVMAENLAPQVLDAAIVAASQKVEHHEIACYGTARTYAEQLGLSDVADLLQQTLDEEYEADSRLTELATSFINQQAEAKA